MIRTITTIYASLVCACTVGGCFEPPLADDSQTLDASNLFPLPRPDAGVTEGSSAVSNAGSCGTAADSPSSSGTTASATDSVGGKPSGSAQGGEDVTAPDTGDALAAGTDAGADAKAPADASTPAEPSGPPSPDTPGQLLITEVMADPAGRTDAEGEWIELLNVSDQTLDLKGCQLGEGVDNDPIFLETVPVEAGQYAAISRNASPGFVPQAVLSMSLRNTYDVVVLRCNGEVIDSLAYDASAQYPIVAGASLSLSPDAVALLTNDSPELFCTSSTDYGGDLGTPGQPNDSCPTE